MGNGDYAQVSSGGAIGLCGGGGCACMRGELSPSVAARQLPLGGSDWALRGRFSRLRGELLGLGAASAGGG